MTPEIELELLLWKRESEQRIRFLEERLDQADKIASQDTSSAFRQRAEILTLRSLLNELCEHQGVSQEHFQTVYSERYKHTLDQLFLSGSERHKASASGLDDRSEDEMYTGDEPLGLFPQG